MTGAPDAAIDECECTELGRRYYGSMPTARRFPPPWSVEETDACFIVKDHAGQALAYVYGSARDSDSRQVKARSLNLWPNNRLDELLPWRSAAARQLQQRAA
jgi:hypothetical protein